MIRILIRFWPVLIPALLCLLWMFYQRRKAHKAGVDLPRFADGPWYWAAVASILIAIGCFLLLGLSSQPVSGEYEPAHVENGKVVPGQVK